MGPNSDNSTSLFMQLDFLGKQAWVCERNVLFDLLRPAMMMWRSGRSLERAMAVEPPTRPVPPSTKTRTFLDLSLYSLWSSFVALHLVNGNKCNGARTAMARPVSRALSKQHYTSMATNTVHSQQVKKNRGLNSSLQLPLINAPYRKFTKLAVSITVHVEAMACRLPCVLGRKKWSLSE
jgi:hypothetical protein